MDVNFQFVLVATLPRFSSDILQLYLENSENPFLKCIESKQRNPGPFWPAQIADLRLKIEKKTKKQNKLKAPE